MRVVGGELSSWIDWGGDQGWSLRSSCPVIGCRGWLPVGEGYRLVTYVTDGGSRAMAQAKAAAWDRDVQVRGARTRRKGCWRPGCWMRCRSIWSWRRWRGGGRSTSSVARRVGDRPGDRHVGGDRHPRTASVAEPDRRAASSGLASDAEQWRPAPGRAAGMGRDSDGTVDERSQRFIDLSLSSVSPSRSAPPK